ncbi:hypothetical protein QYM36_009748 [Artemia franciscana]|uniref:Uncharacterized protein n=1 Tax=Artemia franciscana TaxID=6661 RepID=A0AA88HRL5_ARTSF|nr:hypothetical protein QYM36_009748 [Artemia franciscana]
MSSTTYSNMYETYNCNDYEVYENFEDIDTTSNTCNYDGGYDLEEYFTNGYNYRYASKVKPIPRTTEILPCNSNYVYSIKIRKFKPDLEMPSESAETDGVQNETWGAFEKERLYFGSRIQRLKLNEKGERDPTKEDRDASVNERVSEIWDKISVKSTEEPTSVPAVKAVYVPPSLRNRKKKEAPNLASLQLFPNLGTDESEIDCTIKQTDKESEGFTERKCRTSTLANNRPVTNGRAVISSYVPLSLTRQRKMERPDRFANGDHCNREIPKMPIYERLLMISRQGSEQIAANECAEISANAPPSLTRSRKMEKPGGFTNETRSSQANYVPPTVRSRQSSEKTAAKALTNERTVISAKVPPKTKSKKMERKGGFTNETRSSRGNHVPPFGGTSADVPPTLAGSIKMERPDRFANGDHCNREIPKMPIYERLLMISRQGSEQIAANECAEISANAPPSLTRSRKMEKPGRFTNETRSSRGNHVTPFARSKQSSEQTAAKAHINEHDGISANVPVSLVRKKVGPVT